MRRRIIATIIAIACIMPLTACTSGPQGDVTNEGNGFSTGTVCFDGQKFAVIWVDGNKPYKDMEPMGVTCDTKENQR